MLVNSFKKAIRSNLEAYNGDLLKKKSVKLVPVIKYGVNKRIR